MKNWKKELISNAGILVLISGIIHMGYTTNIGIQNNTSLLISISLVIGGVILYILLNKIIK